MDIEGLMALTQSVQRYQRLRANIGGPLQFDPRRRQDADFVFLAANANAGRLLKSQLKFHYAGDLPVYSTSFIYSMDGRSDADLNGVMFADIENARQITDACVSVSRPGVLSNTSEILTREKLQDRQCILKARPCGPKEIK